MCTSMPLQDLEVLFSTAGVLCSSIVFTPPGGEHSTCLLTFADEVRRVGVRAAGGGSTGAAALLALIRHWPIYLSSTHCS